MATRDYEFGDKAPPKMWQITPLGAAVVEALPDQKKKKRILGGFPL